MKKAEVVRDSSFVFRKNIVKRITNNEQRTTIRQQTTFTEPQPCH